MNPATGADRRDSKATGRTALEGLHVLAISTVAQSLVNQMPCAWDVLLDQGAKITFAAAPDGWEPDLAKWGQFTPLPSSRTLSPRGALRTASEASRLFQRQRWAMVQVQTPIASAIARILPRGSGTPLLYVAHGFHFHADGGLVANAAYGGIEFALAGRASAIAVVSAEDYAAARHLGFHRRVLLWHLPGAGIDLLRFQPRQLAQPDEGLRLLFVGEMNRNKDPLHAVRVAGQLARKLQVNLRMVGEGPLAQPARDLAASAYPELRFEWLSRSPKVEALLGETDVLLAPSRREGLPRVVIEALASGVAVVARSNRGTRELLSGGVGALMARDATVSQWAEAVLHSHRETSPAFCIQRAQRYSENAVAKSYANLVARVTEPTRVSPWRD